ncbi:MAG: hypothetical protein AAGI89_09920 [Pseudomonadota bacterium]
MKQPFHGAAHGPTPDVKTKSELQARLAARSKPKLEPHLRPNGSVVHAVHRQVHVSNEKRIQELRSKLNDRQADLRQQLAQSKGRGLAKAGFGKANEMERAR